MSTLCSVIGLCGELSLHPTGSSESLGKVGPVGYLAFQFFPPIILADPQKLKRSPSTSRNTDWCFKAELFCIHIHLLVTVGPVRAYPELPPSINTMNKGLQGRNAGFSFDPSLPVVSEGTEPSELLRIYPLHLPSCLGIPLWGQQGPAQSRSHNTPTHTVGTWRGHSCPTSSSRESAARLCN